MFKHDLTLYGNISVDTVQNTSSYKTGVVNNGLGSYRILGGVGDALESFIGIDRSLAIKIVAQIGDDEEGTFIQRNLNKSINIGGVRIDTSDILVAPRSKTTTSTVIYNIEDRTQTPITNWGICKKKHLFHPTNTRWNHIMYADTLDYLSYKHLQRMNGVISLDLCYSNQNDSTKRRIFEMLPYVDYLILPEDKAITLSLTKDPLEAAKTLHKKENGVVVIYRPEGSVVYNGTNTTLVKNKHHISNTNISKNAGNTFYASFIYDQLNGSKYIDSVYFAHKNASMTERLL